MKYLFLVLFSFFLCAENFAQNYEPNFESISKRPIPGWFNEAKYGIFVVWGPYSVPSYVKSGYAEWYGKQMNNPSKGFHDRVYGEEFKYEQFADLFKAELWDPELWCDLFDKSGAKYVVTTANYHDGFAMYPSKYSKTENTELWNSMIVGPKRDIIGELKEAGEKKGLKMGIYYSLYEWFHPLWLKDRKRFVTEQFHPKFKEVVSKYEPWFIFLDGEWSQDYKEWKSEELAAWLYNESSCKDYVVVNDRWGQCRGQWGDVYESEYGNGKYTSPNHPWMEDRGIGKSYGYNRAENIFDYDSREELIRTFSNVVGGGGNFLLCVGPTADGRIPVIMQERLLQIGDWMQVNGEAIYGSTHNPFWPHQFVWGTATEKPGKLYLHVQDPGLGEINIDGIKAKINSVVLLHKTGEIPLKYKMKDDNLHVNWPSYLNDQAVTVIKVDIEGEVEYDSAIRLNKDNVIEFNCHAMEIHGEKANVNYSGAFNNLRIIDWTNPKEFISAEIKVAKSGIYDVDLLYKASGDSTIGGEFIFQIGDQFVKGVIEDTSNDRSFKPINIGTIEIKAGEYEMFIKPDQSKTGNWKGFLLQGVRLTKKI